MDHPNRYYIFLLAFGKTKNKKWGKVVLLEGKGEKEALFYIYTICGEKVFFFIFTSLNRERMV